MRLHRFLPLLLATAACAAPRRSGSVEAIRLPQGPVEVRVHDRAGARVGDVVVDRECEAWRLSGTLRGAWLSTPSRRRIRVDAFDSTGAQISSDEGVAALHARVPRKTGIDSAGFALALRDACRVARLEITIADE